MKLSAISFHTELKEFRQKSDETINIYYKRFLILMTRDKIRNRSIVNNLSILKISTLEIILKSFALRLFDENMRKKTICDFIVSNKFFRELCVLAENVF